MNQEIVKEEGRKMARVPTVEQINEAYQAWIIGLKRHISVTQMAMDEIKDPLPMIREWKAMLNNFKTQLKSARQFIAKKEILLGVDSKELDKQELLEIKQKLQYVKDED